MSMLSEIAADVGSLEALRVRGCKPKGAMLLSRRDSRVSSCARISVYMNRDMCEI